MILYETAQQNTEPYAVVTGESLPSAFLNVPARADGLPVRAIAPHAFAGASHLRTVSLPDSIVTIGNFAFHNCGALREISLYDSVTDYGDGVIRQCTSLSGIRLTMRAGYYTLLARMLSDCDNTLTVSLALPDGCACLTFPGFNYDFTENTMARTIQFNIEGSGMAFRECVTRAGIDYAAYDNMLYRAKLDDITITSKLVLNRLTYPYELSARAKRAYEDYITDHAADVLKTLVAAGDTHAVRFLTTQAAHVLPDADAVMPAAQLAASRDLPEITALLTDYAARFRLSAHRRRLTL